MCYYLHVAHTAVFCIRYTVGLQKDLSTVHTIAIHMPPMAISFSNTIPPTRSGEKRKQLHGNPSGWRKLTCNFKHGTPEKFIPFIMGLENRISFALDKFKKRQKSTQQPLKSMWPGNDPWGMPPISDEELKKTNEGFWVHPIIKRDVKNGGQYPPSLVFKYHNQNPDVHFYHCREFPGQNDPTAKEIDISCIPDLKSLMAQCDVELRDVYKHGGKYFARMFLTKCYLSEGRMFQNSYN